MAQRFAFGFADTLLAEVGGVPLRDLHFDVDAMVQVCEAARPIAERLGAHPPVPHLAGFTYPHIAALGARITFPEHSDPAPSVIIGSPEEIDTLAEPNDYLAAPLIRARLDLLDRLLLRRPDAVRSIGHPFEGPVTTAALIMGPGFFTLPYDDPARAHKLLEFSTTSAINYARAIGAYLGHEWRPGTLTIPDDFAGIFPPAKFREFVLPYWERLYSASGCATRALHSELIRPEHLPLLAEVKLDVFDPSVDQYVTPEILREQCPCAFQGRIKPWEVRDLSADELERLYRRIAAHEPTVIAFSMDSLDEEDKVRRLLEVARELEV